MRSPPSVFSWAICAISVLMRLSALRCVSALTPRGRMRVQAVYECLGFHAHELFEQTGGFELVAGLEVIEFAFDGGDEEVQ